MKVKFLGIAVVVLCASTISLADDGDTNELDQCGLIADASARLACYDRLNGRQPSTSSTEVIEDIASPNTGDNDFGSKSKDEKKSIVVAVSRCVEDPHKKFVFYLENGQTWKQISSRRLDFEECDFNVTLSKDFFGYKMQKEGEKSRFRVSRID